MSKLIDADAFKVENARLLHCDFCDITEVTLEELIDDAPTIDAVPIAWINKHLEWLDNCDNDFAQLAKVGIRGMLELWRKDCMLNEQTN